jgi:hypothetical protein
MFLVGSLKCRRTVRDPLLQFSIESVDFLLGRLSAGDVLEVNGQSFFIRKAAALKPFV